MKCVVTGGLGFIGRHLVHELASRGFEVAVYDISDNPSPELQPGVSYIQGDIRDQEKLLRATQETEHIYHLSGLLGTSELFADPALAINVNIIGALNVLQAAKANSCQKVFLPAKPNEWNNIYSMTAQAVEKLGQAFRDYHNIDVRILKIWNVYGPHQKLLPIRKAIPLFLAQAITGSHLTVFGSGAQKLELIHARDLARTITDFMSLESRPLETFEIRSSGVISILDLAHLIIRLSKSNSITIKKELRIGEHPTSIFARARDVRDLNLWNFSTTIEQGLQETIDWYRRLPQSTLKSAIRFHEQAR